MKKTVFSILVFASFICGLFLSPKIGLVAVMFGMALGGITCCFIIRGRWMRLIGIGIGLSSMFAIAIASVALNSVPDVFPPYPSGIMNDLFPADEFPSSEKSLDEIETRLHWYGFLASAPISIGVMFLVSRSSRNHTKITP